jgi:hypothetical protein
VEQHDDAPFQWIRVHAAKGDSTAFTVWLLVSAWPGQSLAAAQQAVLRYILIPEGSTAVEYSNALTGQAVLPDNGAWQYLLPRTGTAASPFDDQTNTTSLLGLPYSLIDRKQGPAPPLPAVEKHVRLRPDLLIGVPHNTKQRDDTRRYDETDYEYVLLTEANYREMMEHGMNCFRVNREQAQWVQWQNVYFWGTGGADVPYPQCLYQSNYIGPALFFDEPMVGTRDHAIRPMFQKDPALRRSITPARFLEAFEQVYHETKYSKAPTQLLEGLSARPDVDTGDMRFLQENMYTWETMVASALYQLSEGRSMPPNAIVFEPPGRFGTRRVLPELNMSFDCQIPADDPKHLAGIIYGFLRGAARATGKDWGVSIYGAVDRADAPWLLTHAYDLGGTRFFYWDTYQLAAVPYNEYLRLSAHLRDHAKNQPARNQDRLKNAAEVAILLPPGYNLGHVKMGIGNISGLPELNMERTNTHGVKYRRVMGNFLTEIERCIRLGVGFDLLWRLDSIAPQGYREIVVIREDGMVEVSSRQGFMLLDSARVPERPAGDPPKLAVDVYPGTSAAPAEITVRALVTTGSAPVYYTQGANAEGIYRNQIVLWELYGPEPEDYTDFWGRRWDAPVTHHDGYASSELRFAIEKPGHYRLRVSTSDLAGRSATVWKELHVE